MRKFIKKYRTEILITVFCAFVAIYVLLVAVSTLAATVSPEAITAQQLPENPTTEQYEEYITAMSNACSNCGSTNHFTCTTTTGGGQIAVPMAFSPFPVNINAEYPVITVDVFGLLQGTKTITSTVPEQFAENVTVEIGDAPNTIIVTGIRPNDDVPPITGSFDVSVARNGLTRTFEVNVNLETTYEPPEEPNEQDEIMSILTEMNKVQQATLALIFIAFSIWLCTQILGSIWHHFIEVWL